MRKKDKIWYSIEKKDKQYVVWLNKEEEHSGGVRGIFKGTRQECINYCRENKIKVRR